MIHSPVDGLGPLYVYRVTDSFTFRSVRPQGQEVSKQTLGSESFLLKKWVRLDVPSYLTPRKTLSG